MKAPCKDCPNRHYACHDKCEKYKEFTDANQRMSELKYKYHHEEEYEIQKHARLRKIAESKRGANKY